jgi:hypothetical protein
MYESQNGASAPFWFSRLSRLQLAQVGLFVRRYESLGLVFAVHHRPSSGAAPLVEASNRISVFEPPEESDV